MKCSANEVMTLAAKAARGAGAPPAQAADFGTAALRHLQAGREVQNLTDALEHLPTGPILLLPLQLLRITENTRDDVARGEFSRAECGGLAQSYLDAQPYETLMEKSGDSARVTLFLDKPKATHISHRVFIPNSLVTLLQTYAARMLVPETDASRLSGAGAGLNDND
jgi:hypothetical protein